MSLKLFDFFVIDACQLDGRCCSSSHCPIASLHPDVYSVNGVLIFARSRL